MVVGLENFVNSPIRTKITVGEINMASRNVIKKILYLFAYGWSMFSLLYCLFAMYCSTRMSLPVVFFC